MKEEEEEELVIMKLEISSLNIASSNKFFKLSRYLFMDRLFHVNKTSRANC